MHRRLKGPELELPLVLISAEGQQREGRGGENPELQGEGVCPWRRPTPGRCWRQRSWAAKDPSGVTYKPLTDG